MASTLAVLLGYNYRLTIETAAGSISMSQHNEWDVEETTTKKAADINESLEELQAITKVKAKFTVKGLRGMNNCYGDLPRTKTRVIAWKCEVVDEDGTVITGVEDIPNLVKSAQNPDGYTLWAVTEKRGKQNDGAGDFELVLESGIVNARA